MNYDAAAVADKGEWMGRGTVWVICIEEGGSWVPRLDLKLALDENVARAFAKEQTQASERLHAAFPFASLDPQFFQSLVHR